MGHVLLYLFVCEDKQTKGLPTIKGYIGLRGIYFCGQQIVNTYLKIRSRTRYVFETTFKQEERVNSMYWDGQCEQTTVTHNTSQY